MAYLCWTRKIFVAEDQSSPLAYFCHLYHISCNWPDGEYSFQDLGFTRPSIQLSSHRIDSRVITAIYTTIAQRSLHARNWKQGTCIIYMRT
ncbi:hypothetical protein PAXRUDRAFT_228644 [Paxillus rubicundulus Ve08.2h10]|uniref:Uncharacterized protein n=1 Tax=Paxillus rubicundulus Ve08.2h10 TaxID=930991 RepID=A0A0D0DH33_9AGAM|nr:hypothetical protein PAXRUDRAFT_228644 [Paxillus rubicundulus Ve08.2h10]